MPILSIYLTNIKYQFESNDESYSIYTQSTFYKVPK